MAVKLSVTGPGATSGCAPNGIATNASGGVVTVEGALNTAAALPADVCTGTLSAVCVVTFEPLACASSSVSAAPSPA